VHNEKLKRRIEKTKKENQQIIAGAMSDGLSTTVYRATMVKFLLSRGARRDLTVPPFASGSSQKHRDARRSTNQHARWEQAYLR